MKNLWSPWRSQYIESFFEQTANKNCIFCEMFNQNIEDDKSLVVYKDDASLIALNLYPYNNGHLMIAPKKHTGDLLSLTKDDLRNIYEKIQLAAKALNSVMKPHGFNIGANIGKVAGAGIDDHIHFHIVPRWNGDSNFMPVLGEVKVISQDLLTTKLNLKKEIKNILLNKNES
jgi:ATP adenylyltransferase